jgi:hypothetical protein
MKNKYLTRKGYAQWLRDQGTGTQVGVSRVINECPIARYLDHQTNREWHVSPLACVPRVRSEVEEHEFRTPKWAKAYIHNLDRHFGKHPKPISADEALYVLEEYYS